MFEGVFEIASQAEGLTTQPAHSVSCTSNYDFAELKTEKAGKKYLCLKGFLAGQCVTFA